jgi:hypothetical protein
MTCTITFKAKVVERRFVEGELASRKIKIPRLTLQHCSVQAFRTSKRFGAYANSALFPAVLARALRDDFKIVECIDLRAPLPAGVTVDETGFLARVTIILTSEQP